ncbi:hypothetical protein WG936_10100 [Corynebacterium sp. H127]|uniref:hypothetical protein n=1 Tax=Corynebacterium sp. H127 TaxID=3133418 RepID=UPI003098F3A8
MTTAKFPVLIVVATLALGLSSCGADKKPEPEVHTAVVTVTTTSELAPTPPPIAAVTTTSTKQIPPPPPPQQASPSNFQQEMAAKLQQSMHPGDPIEIYGNNMTLCTQGDGYGIHMLAAGENTSCEFALALMGAQIAGLNATDDNVREHLQPSVAVTSPVTNQPYTMTCGTDANKVITCSGGNDALVVLY